MGAVNSFVAGVAVAFLLPAQIAAATVINEILEPPTTPGNAWMGTFEITPSTSLWAFGIGNDLIQDTSISGVSFIDGLSARDHWISSLISRTSWEAGYNFDSIRPIGATSPSSFFPDTSTIAWQWGSSQYVAFYWLSEAGDDPNNPLAVLQANTTYDAFRFFTDGPNSPFAAFTSADGSGAIVTGETNVIIVPAPTGAMALLGAGAWVSMRRRR
jgi:hypothetical protein